MQCICSAYAIRFCPSLLRWPFHFRSELYPSPAISDNHLQLKGSKCPSPTQLNRPTWKIWCWMGAFLSGSVLFFSQEIVLINIYIYSFTHIHIHIHIHIYIHIHIDMHKYNHRRHSLPVDFVSCHLQRMSGFPRGPIPLLNPEQNQHQSNFLWGHPLNHPNGEWCKCWDDTGESQ